MIFENASAVNSGGSLTPGTRMYLGKVPAGMRIGFFLIANGWTGSGVDFNRRTYYSNVLCDMTTDGGGWTLLGKGVYQSSELPEVLAGGANAMLQSDRRTALLANGTSLFRLQGLSSGNTLYIKDSAPLFHPCPQVGSGGLDGLWVR